MLNNKRIFTVLLAWSIIIFGCVNGFGRQDESAEKILSQRRSKAESYRPQQITSKAPIAEEKPVDTEKEITSVQEKKVKKKKLQATVEGVRLELNGCASQPENKSISCSMTVYSVEHDSDIVLFCYSGTSATDKAGNSYQCGNVSIEDNSAWNYTFNKLLKGEKAKAVIRLEAENKSSALAELNFKRALSEANVLSQIDISFSVNEIRKKLIFENVSVLQ